VSEPVAASLEDLDGFITIVAEVSERDATGIAVGSRLIDDLGMDSLALTELVLVCIESFGVDELADSLERDWEAVTVGDLHRECCAALAARRTA
jgi:acyl carrier protein